MILGDNMRTGQPLLEPVGVLDRIVSEHAEEAATLWSMRTAAVDGTQLSLGEVAKLDMRLEAHIDGLRIAGEAGWKICEEQLANGPGEVFTAGVQAFESTDM